MLRTFLNAKVSVSKQRKGAFRARKTLQNPGYSVLKQMRALFFRSYASASVKRKLLRITSKVRIQRFTPNIT